MRRLTGLGLLLLTGCSTAPIADMLDFFKPGRLERGNTQPYGGVCIPQGGSIGGPSVVTPPPAPPGGLPPAPPGGTGTVFPPPTPPGGPGVVTPPGELPPPAPPAPVNPTPPF
jgi:hypothetical protein